MHCFDQLEDAFEGGAIDELELQSGILTIATLSGRNFVLSKHAPSQQLWYASPLQGGLHFRFDESEQCWALPDGRVLNQVVRADLHAEGVEVVL